MDPGSSSVLYAGTGFAGTLGSMSPTGRQAAPVSLLFQIPPAARLNAGRRFDETRGAGVFRTVDVGDTWSQLAGSSTPIPTTSID
jgi:hypothetical protein